ncbi:MAG: hypothetical protein R3C14_21930 [Caldilineaceae bacterium]
MLAQILALQESGKHEQASKLLAQHVLYLLEHLDLQVIQGIIIDFPPTLLHENADLRYLEGILYARSGQPQEAMHLLERAQFSYTYAKRYNEVARCYLELARIYHSREQYRMAYHYLHEEVKPLIAAGQATETTLRIQCYLHMADIVMEMGRISSSIAYAQQALTLCIDIDDYTGQFRALVRIASTSIQLGNYREASQHIQEARAMLENYSMSTTIQARLLNAEIHLYWYQQRQYEALAHAQEYLQLVDQQTGIQPRLYARILLGNLNRDAGDFTQAAAWYTATRRLIEEIDYNFYYPWLNAQQAWLYVLQGNLELAHLHISRGLQNADLGRAMSFQVILAVIYLLENKLEGAQHLLQESLDFYEQSGDHLSCCAIQMHLAYHASRAYNSIGFLTYMEKALGWLSDQQLERFPHWWHSTIVATVCSQALLVGIYPSLVERIFVNHLAEAGIGVLTGLLSADGVDIRLQASRLLEAITGRSAQLLAHLATTPAKRELLQLMQQGLLRADSYRRLEQELTTSPQRHTPNPTLVAVYGLYVNGFTRAQIAERLECSLENVRNYITFIYQHFELSADQFPNRSARRKQLTEVARMRGFIY